MSSNAEFSQRINERKMVEKHREKDVSYLSCGLLEEKIDIFLEYYFVLFEKKCIFATSYI